MLNKLLEADWRAAGRPRRVGVALSGGGDSVALFHVADALAAKRELTLAALHVDHRLRAASDEDAAFCRDLARRLGQGFAWVALDPTSWSGNVHHAARAARYAALEKMAAQNDLDLIWTAHTLDDQAETVLQRLMRGTGPDGLSGVAAVNGIFRRPFLSVRRAQLREFLQQHGAMWREDPSNDDRRYLRTRMRREVLPVLVEVGGESVLQSLSRLAMLAREQRNLLDEITIQDYDSCRAGNDLLVDGLTALSPARRDRVLRAWLREYELVPPAQSICQLGQLLAGEQTKGPLTLPGGLRVWRLIDRLTASEPDPGTKPLPKTKKPGW